MASSNSQNNPPAKRRKVVVKSKAKQPTELSRLVSSDIRSTVRHSMMSVLDFENDDVETSPKVQSEDVAKSSEPRRISSAFDEAINDRHRVPARLTTGSSNPQGASKISSQTSSEQQGFCKAKSEFDADIKSLLDLRAELDELLKQAMDNSREQQSIILGLQEERDSWREKYETLEQIPESRLACLDDLEASNEGIFNQLQVERSLLEEKNQALQRELTEEKLKSKQLEDKARIELANERQESELRGKIIQDLRKKIGCLEEDTQYAHEKHKGYDRAWAKTYSRYYEDHGELSRKLDENERSRQLDVEGLQAELDNAHKGIAVLVSEKKEAGLQQKQSSDILLKAQKELKEANDRIVSLQAEQLRKTDMMAELQREHDSKLTQVTLQAQSFDSMLEQSGKELNSLMNNFEKRIQDLEKKMDSLDANETAMSSALVKVRSELEAKTIEHQALFGSFERLELSHRGCRKKEDSLNQALESQNEHHERAILAEKSGLAEDLKAILHVSSKLPLGMLQRLSLSTNRVSVLDTCNSENKDLYFLYGQPLRPKSLTNMEVGGYLENVMRIAFLASDLCPRKLTDLLWSLWGTLEFGHTSVQDREVLAMPLISLVRKLFRGPSESVPQIALWVGCQIACHVLAWLPSDVDLVEVIDFTNLKEVTPLVRRGCSELTAQDHRRRHLTLPVVPSFLQPAAHSNVDVFMCRYGSLDTMAYTHWTSEEITFAIGTGDGKYVLWHHEFSQCSCIKGGLGLAMELPGGIDGTSIRIDRIRARTSSWQSRFT